MIDYMFGPVSQGKGLRVHELQSGPAYILSLLSILDNYGSIK